MVYALNSRSENHHAQTNNIHEGVAVAGGTYLFWGRPMVDLSCKAEN